MPGDTERTTRGRLNVWKGHAQTRSESTTVPGFIWDRQSSIKSRQKSVSGNVGNNVYTLGNKHDVIATSEHRAIMRACNSCDVTVVSEVAWCWQEAAAGGQNDVMSNDFTAPLVCGCETQPVRLFLRSTAVTLFVWLFLQHRKTFQNTFSWLSSKIWNYLSYLQLQDRGMRMKRGVNVICWLCNLAGWCCVNILRSSMHRVRQYVPELRSLQSWDSCSCLVFYL